MTRRVAILGCTGSIGRQALEVVGDDPDLAVCALSAGSDRAGLEQAAVASGAVHVQLAADTRDLDAGELTYRATIGGLVDAAEPDVVLNAIVGFAGLEATVAALERGVDVALANKESLVAAGALCVDTARRTGARILPVDSEHSALLQCVGGSPPEEVESLVLTASGGPFFGMRSDELASVTVEAALAHPTWSMGGKITIDSATLMNKGLELIEACVLFDMPPERVEVVVHRHSIVHAMVRHRDGSLLAHLGWPDMRVPIAYALRYPVRPRVAARRLDLMCMPALEFHPPDTETFRCLALARAAAETGGSAPCILNAANEIAVEAFLGGRLGFGDVAAVVERTLDRTDLAGDGSSLEAVREVDRRARAVAADAIGRQRTTA